MSSDNEEQIFKEEDFTKFGLYALHATGYQITAPTSNAGRLKAFAKAVDKFLIFILQLPSNIVFLFKHFGRRRFQNVIKNT